MQKKRYMSLLLAFTLFLSACTNLPDDGAAQTTTHAYETEAADNYTLAPTEADLPDETEKETEPTQPLHSELYLPDCTPQQITEYFEEVVLNMEYTDGTGSADLVQKWLTPIYYRLYGVPTDSDKEVLNALFEQLNAVPGFPGIYAAEDESHENLSISFMEPAEFRDSFSAAINGEDAYGAAQFWYYTLTNELHTARIGCRTDLDQSTRNSVLVEEVINILGITDTTLRPDSITYQYSDENTALSDIDLVILMLLYDPSIQCGMTAESCSAIIQKLYY